MNFRVADFQQNDNNADFQPPSSPPFTGTLTTDHPEGVGRFLHRLLGLPNGIRFRELRWLRGTGEGFSWITTLLNACSGTLERVDLESQVCGESRKRDPSVSAVRPALRSNSLLSQMTRHTTPRLTSPR